MDHRHTRLTAFTLAVLIFYAPIETWYSIPELWDPFYLVDFIGILLLIWGVLRLRRGQALPRVGMLIAGYAWTAANFWRAFFWRISEVAAGNTLDYGWEELCFTACVLIAAVAGLVWSLAVYRPIGTLGTNA